MRRNPWAACPGTGRCRRRLGRTRPPTIVPGTHASSVAAHTAQTPDQPGRCATRTRSTRLVPCPQHGQAYLPSRRQFCRSIPSSRSATDSRSATGPNASSTRSRSANGNGGSAAVSPAGPAGSSAKGMIPPETSGSARSGVACGSGFVFVQVGFMLSPCRLSALDRPTIVIRIRAAQLSSARSRCRLNRRVLGPNRPRFR